jgi:hypothetical protein
VPVLPEWMDEASLGSGEDSRLGDTADSVFIVETSTCLLERSGTGELERASWEGSDLVSIRRELLISVFVRPSSCLS